MLDKIFGLFSDAKDLASEAIEDPDKKNALDAKLNEIQQAVYIAELQTKTIPWVDAMHKMARPMISLVSIITFALVISFNPDIDIVKLLTGGGVAGLYTALKGKGN